MRILSLNALGVGAVVLFPAIAYEMEIQGIVLWRLTSAFALTCLAGAAWVHSRRVAGGDHRGLPEPLHIGSWTFGPIAGVLFGSNLIGFPFAPSAGPILAAAGLILALAALQFCYLLFVVTETQGSGA